MDKASGKCKLTSRSFSLRSDSSHQEAESLEDLETPEKIRSKKFIKTKFNSQARQISDDHSSADEQGETYENI